MNSQSDNGAGVALLAFVLVFFLLIMPVGGVCYAYRKPIADGFKSLDEKVKSQAVGATHYKALSPTELLKDSVKNDGFVFVLADWCGHCKNLKSSGELYKLAKDIDVIVMDDKHPETPFVMKTLNSNGFPTIGMFKDGKLVSYAGGRTAEEMKAVFLN